jgi:lipoprotein signal peptidase
MIRIIADVAGTIGMLLFLMAELRQFYKIKKTGKLTGLSFHAYMSKLIAVASTGICFALTALYFSLFVIILEGIVIMPILYWLWKYRNKPHVEITVLDELWNNPEDARWDEA